MKKVNWEKVGNFIMNTIGFVVGSIIVYTAVRIAIAVITAIYVVLSK
jgi:hypothetical protein